MSEARRTQRPSKPHSPATMHVCAACSSELVQPVEWEERPGDGWSVVLRCPECEWRGGGNFGQKEIDDYDRRLDEGMRSMIEDLRKLTRENMERDLEDLIAALDGDLVLPEDF